MSEKPAVLYDAQNGVATVTLNRPESRNALNLAMCEGLLAAVRAAAADGDIRLLVVRGAGEAFCAGADLKERKTMNEAEVLARRLRGFYAYDALERLPVPTLAVVQGPAAGSGLEIAAACDMVVASKAATFWTPEAQWGTIGATQRLARIVGRKLAKDLMFTGRRLSADEALQTGLVTRVVAHEGLDACAQELIEAIVKAPPLAMRLAKECIDRGVELDPRGAMGLELLAIERNMAGSDWRGAIGSFGAASRHGAQS